MSDTSRKGRLVEQIVAMLHETPYVRVEKRAMLPPIGGIGRKREIDVLVTANIAEFLVWAAIECKNEGKPIGALQIDAFFGKLDYLGIPAHLGIFISVSPFTLGAKQRAKAAGIKLSRLTGLTADRLSALILTALQSVIYLFMSVEQVKYETSVQVKPSIEDGFVNESGQSVGTAFDTLLDRWIDGELPTSLDEHEIRVVLPIGWGMRVNGSFERIEAIDASVTVTAIVVTHEGQVVQHALIESEYKTVDKLHISATFDEAIPPLRFERFGSEDALQNHLAKVPGIHMSTGRFRLSRLSGFDDLENRVMIDLRQ